MSYPATRLDEFAATEILKALNKSWIVTHIDLYNFELIVRGWLQCVIEINCTELDCLGDTNQRK